MTLWNTLIEFVSNFSFFWLNNYANATPSKLPFLLALSFAMHIINNSQVKMALPKIKVTFWHQMFHKSVDIKASHDVFMVIMHGLPTSHSIPSFVRSYLRGSILPTRISSQMLWFSYNEHLALRSQKLFEAFVTTKNFVNPCSTILKYLFLLILF